VTTPPLNLIQSLADTAGPAEDLLGDRDDAAAWLRTARLLPPDAGLSGSEHNAFLRLRDALVDVLRARAEARADADAAIRLTRALADGRLVVTIEPAGTSGLASSARASYSSLVAAIAMAVHEAFRD
jgi:Putative stress-induced transcription regulator